MEVKVAIIKILCRESPVRAAFCADFSQYLMGVMEIVTGFLEATYDTY
jgi:hypothetical protein